MIGYCNKNGILCAYTNQYGYCTITACTKTSEVDAV